MCCASTVLDMTLSSAQGPKNKMPPACLWVTCTKLGDSHSTQGLGLHKSRCTSKWAAADSSCRVQLLTYRMPVSPGLVVRKGWQGVIWSARKDQPLRYRLHCIGAEGLLYIINQLMRLTLEYLISEDEALLEREGRSLKSCGRSKLVEFLTTICHLIKVNCHFSVQSISQSYFLDQKIQFLLDLWSSPSPWNCTTLHSVRVVALQPPWQVLPPPGTCPTESALTVVFW